MALELPESILQLKYVIIEPEHCAGWEVPVVFPAMIEHALMTGKGRPISAGFCVALEDGHLACHGESLSLKLQSRPDEDAAILNQWLSGVPTAAGKS